MVGVPLSFPVLLLDHPISRTALGITLFISKRHVRIPSPIPKAFNHVIAEFSHEPHLNKTTR